jgi:hypothetical protein
VAKVRRCQRDEHVGGQRRSDERREPADDQQHPAGGPGDGHEGRHEAGRGDVERGEGTGFTLRPPTMTVHVRRTSGLAPEEDVAPPGVRRGRERRYSEIVSPAGMSGSPM